MHMDVGLFPYNTFSENLSEAEILCGKIQFPLYQFLLNTLYLYTNIRIQNFAMLFVSFPIWLLNFSLYLFPGIHIMCMICEACGPKLNVVILHTANILPFLDHEQCSFFRETENEISQS